MSNDIGKTDLPEIEDQFDTDSAEYIIVVGYPRNKDRLSDLIFWSCNPNDMVCWITYPYIDSLRDDILAPAMSEFLEFHAEVKQFDYVATVFEEFINPRGQEFRSLVEESVKSNEGKALFLNPEYLIKP